jgi:hypothetical protein
MSGVGGIISGSGIGVISVLTRGLIITAMSEVG